MFRGPFCYKKKYELVLNFSIKNAGSSIMEISKNHGRIICTRLLLSVNQNLRVVVGKQQPFA